jgi:hypothetical protein
LGEAAEVDIHVGEYSVHFREGTSVEKSIDLVVRVGNVLVGVVMGRHERSTGLDERAVVGATVVEMATMESIVAVWTDDVKADEEIDSPEDGHSSRSGRWPSHHMICPDVARASVTGHRKDTSWHDDSSCCRGIPEKVILTKAPIEKLSGCLLFSSRHKW